MLNREEVLDLRNLKQDERAHRVADIIQSRSHYVYNNDGRELYKYNEKLGFYLPDADLELGREIEEALGEHNSSSLVNEVTKLVIYQRGRTFDIFDSNPNILILGNGILNIETGEFAPHNPEYLALRGIPVDYDANAACPIWERIINGILPPHYVIIVQMWFGFCLMGGYKYHKIFVATGPTHCGKTTVSNVLTGLLEGRPVVDNMRFRNTRGASMKDLAEQIYSRYQLIGKYANICDDMGSEVIKHMGYLKKLSGGSTVEVRDLYKSPFSVFNSAKLMFSCNETPQTDTTDMAWWDRVLLMPFVTPHAEEDSTTELDVWKKVTAEELPGVLNWALKGAEMLNSLGHFPDMPIEEKRFLWDAYSGDSINAFIVEVVTKDPMSEEKIYNKHLYETYCNYCLGKPFKIASYQGFLTQFGRRVNVRSGQDNMPVGREHWVKGIKIRS